MPTVPTNSPICPSATTWSQPFWCFSRPGELPVSVTAGAVATVPIVLQFWRLDALTVVAEEPRVFSRNFVTEPMMRQQSSITGVTSVVDNLPGVSVQEGDAYSFDDWSSNVTMRGFQATINDVQIGTTIDGIPNGTSDYWSGAKANRFIDPMNLGGVEVSQGTADIASRSVEALGGTFNFLTAAPAAEQSYMASATIGENEGQRFAARVETGSLFGGTTRAWVAAVRQEATDWVQGSARNEREHIAAKLVSSHGRLDLTSYISVDEIHEDTYQRLYSEADFRQNPRWDRLVGEWPGVPYLNQFYRPGWQTRRTNTLAYVRGDWSFSELSFLSAGAYYHRNRGRGDWLPPYIVDVVDDGDGPGVGAGGPPAGAGRRPARTHPFRGPQWRCRRADARVHVFVHLQLLWCGRPGGRPGVPPGSHGGAVLPSQPLREGPRRPNARRGVVRFFRQGWQRAARRHLVRGFAARPWPGLAPDAGSEAQLQVGRAGLLAPV